jgi:hypothetical protein
VGTERGRGLADSNIKSPDLSFFVPAANENRWSDLLATLISTDPDRIARLLWVARMWAPASAPGHHVTAELQEGMSAYEWRPDPKRPHDHDRVEAGLPARLREGHVEARATASTTR